MSNYEALLGGYQCTLANQELYQNSEDIGCVSLWLRILARYLMEGQLTLWKRIICLKWTPTIAIYKIFYVPLDILIKFCTKCKITFSEY